MNGGYGYLRYFGGLVVSLLLFGCTSQYEYPISGLQLRAYTAVLEAVTAASNRYNPISLREDREFMGLILQRGNSFFYTVAAGQIGEDTISITMPHPHYGRAVAMWHTHGRPGNQRRYFSPEDKALVRKLDLPFYLADDTGYLKVFTPASTTLSTIAARRLGLSNIAGMAKGELVESHEGVWTTIATLPEEN